MSDLILTMAIAALIGVGYTLGYAHGYQQARTPLEQPDAVCEWRGAFVEPTCGDRP